MGTKKSKYSTLQVYNERGFNRLYKVVTSLDNWSDYNGALVARTVEPLMNQQANNFEKCLEMKQFTVPHTNNYQLDISFKHSMNTVSKSIHVELRIVNVTQSTATVRQLLVVEEKDAAGGQGVVADIINNNVIVGQLTNGTDTRATSLINLDMIFNGGDEYIIQLWFKSDSIDTRATILSSSIRLNEKTIG